MRPILFCAALLLGTLQLFADQHPADQPSLNGTLYGFVENKGQIRDQFKKVNPLVKFLLSTGDGMNVQLKANSFSYDTYEATGNNKNAGRLAKAAISGNKVLYAFHRVDISFPGAAPNPHIIAKEPLSHTLHYFDEKNEEINVSLYSRIIYQNIYPHIDLIFEVNPAAEKNGFEYYFIVHPGGNPAQIKMQYDGADKVQEKGNTIEWQAKGKTVTEHIPASYLMDHDISDLPDLSKENKVSVKYRAIKENVFGFNIPVYSKKQTLVIDPTPDLVWGTYYGGKWTEFGQSLARDAQGNIFLGGFSETATGIATAGAYQSAITGVSDGIIGKFTANGKLVWMTYYGGNAEEHVVSIAVDKVGNVFATGFTFSVNSIASPGCFQAVKGTIDGYHTGFITKFDNDGHRIWSTYYGGEGHETGNAIAIDQDNNIVVAGTTWSATGLATPGAYQTALNFKDEASVLRRKPDLFLAKFDQAGNRIWGTYYGGEGTDKLEDIEIDKANNILLGGSSTSVTNFATDGAYQSQIEGNGDTTSAFIAKFTSTGRPVWCTYYGTKGGTGSTRGITCDDDNNVYAAGETSSSENIATPGAHQTTLQGAWRYNGFIVKFTPAGNRLWGTYYGGASTCFISDITSDGKNFIWVTGTVGGAGDINTPDAYQPDCGPFGAIYIAKLDLSGTRIWGTYYGHDLQSPFGDQGESIIADGDGDVYVCGQTMAKRNISTCGAVQPNWKGEQDAFLARFSDKPVIRDPSITIRTIGPVCDYTNVTFSASVLNAGDTPIYQWQINGVVVGTNTATFTTSNIREGDIITCILTPNSPCVSGTPITSNSIVMKIDMATPAVNINTIPDVVCKGTPVNFTTTATDAGDAPEYTWFVNGIAADSTGPSYVNSRLNNNDIIQCRLIKHNACNIDSIAWSNAVTLAVTESLTPYITISVSGDNVCEGEPVRFDAVWENAGDIPSYQWQINGSPTNYHTIDLLTNTLHPNDVVECVLTVSPTGCFTTPTVVSNAITPVIYPIPDISITGDSIIIKGNNTQLNAVVTGDIASYRWTPENTLSNAAIANPVATPLSSSIYEITVVSTEGCQASEKYSVTVIPGIILPTAFSPNGDGKNDVFKAQYGTDISHVAFRVYNRLGQIVFEDKGTRQGWNGRLNGVDQPMGTFIWSFEYTTRTGGKQVLKGTVLLVR